MAIRRPKSKPLQEGMLRLHCGFTRTLWMWENSELNCVNQTDTCSEFTVQYIDLQLCLSGSYSLSVASKLCMPVIC